MKKLYYVTYEIEYRGWAINLFGNKMVAVDQGFRKRYLPISKGNITNKLNKEAQNKIKNWNKNIINRGYIMLWDYSYGRI